MKTKLIAALLSAALLAGGPSIALTHDGYAYNYGGMAGNVYTNAGAFVPRTGIYQVYPLDSYADGYPYGYMPGATPCASPASNQSSLPPNINVQVQKALAQLGYYDGPFDGNVWPESRTAIAITLFQRDNYMPITGEVDGDLIAALFGKR